MYRHVKAKIASSLVIALLRFQDRVCPQMPNRPVYRVIDQAGSDAGIDKRRQPEHDVTELRSISRMYFDIGISDQVNNSPDFPIIFHVALQISQRYRRELFLFRCAENDLDLNPRPVFLELGRVLRADGVQALPENIDNSGFEFAFNIPNCLNAHDLTP